MRMSTFILLSAACLTGCGGSSDSVATSPATGPVVVGSATPAVTGLKTVTFGDFDDAKLASIARIAPRVGGLPDPTVHDVLVVNASQSGQAPIEAFLTAGKTVVLVNATADNKLKYSPVAVRGPSRIYAVRRGVDASGRPEYVVLDWPTLPLELPADSDAGEFEARMATFLNAASSSASFNPPAGLVYSTVHYSTSLTGPTFFDTRDGGSKYKTPQIPRVNADYTIRVFLDQAATPRQIVSVETSLQAVPFSQLQGSYAMLADAVGGFIKEGDIGWFQLGLENFIEPNSSTVFQGLASSPSTQSNVETVTTGISFAVNYLNAQRQPSVFQYNSSTSNSLSGWKVQSNGGTGAGDWVYLNQDPFQADDTNLWSYGGYGGGYTGPRDARGDSFRQPNALAQTQLTVDTQIAFATSSVLDSVQDFGCNVSPTYANVWTDHGTRNSVKAFGFPFTLGVNLGTASKP